jgi:ring-1,2-phenylacetyl-CoA epoxidase subunit PaaB
VDTSGAQSSFSNVCRPAILKTGMRTKSLDPRIARTELLPQEEWTEAAPLDQHETWEVFHQPRRGAQPVHAGSLHAPTVELALAFAKEQYARRAHCSGIWVVRTADVFTIGTEEDSDIFQTTPEKTYREAGGYRVGARLTAFKRNRAAEQNDEE